MLNTIVGISVTGAMVGNGVSVGGGVSVGVGVLVGVAVCVGVGVLVGVGVGVAVGCTTVKGTRRSLNTGSSCGVKGLSGPKMTTRRVTGPEVPTWVVSHWANKPFSTWLGW